MHLTQQSVYFYCVSDLMTEKVLHVFYSLSCWKVKQVDFHLKKNPHAGLDIQKIQKLENEFYPIQYEI